MTAFAHIKVSRFAGYVTSLHCDGCGKSAPVPCLVPGLDDEWIERRDAFAKKHTKCAKKMDPHEGESDG
jgi:hypothetical protein